MQQRLRRRFCRRCAQYFEKPRFQRNRKTLGELWLKFLATERNLNRKSLCTKLLSRLQRKRGAEEEQHYHMLLGLLFER